MTATAHGTAIRMGNSSLLFRGRSGVGKSLLAWHFICERGASLLADDQVLLEERQGQLWPTAPAALHGLLEVRHVGILRLDVAEPAPLRLVVDLGVATPPRLPDWQESTFVHGTIRIPCLHLSAVHGLTLWQVMAAYHHLALS